MAASPRILELRQGILEKNDQLAADLRARFHAAGLYAVNLVSSPGTGKTALIGMTKTLAKEWGRYLVNVNCVGFGLILTRMTEEFSDKPHVHQVGEREVTMGVPEGFQKASTKMIPLGRAGTPDDAANAVYLFCIPESDYISGEVVLASGGLVI